MVMVDIKVIRSFQPYKEGLDGILWLNGVIWTVSSKSSRVIGQRPKTDRELDIIEEIVCHLKNPGGIAWDGSGFLVTEKVEKIVYKIDLQSKQLSVYLDLTKAKDIASTQILKAEGSTVTGIAFNKGKIWITCQAGYSSSIYCFDSESKELVTWFFARGPQPLGIAFEANGDLAWVLDGSNKELRQFDVSGKWTDTLLKVPLEKPSGLTIDDQNMFWMVDLETKEVFQMGKGV